MKRPSQSVVCLAPTPRHPGKGKARKESTMVDPVTAVDTLVLGGILRTGGGFVWPGGLCRQQQGEASREKLSFLAELMSDSDR